MIASILLMPSEPIPGYVIGFELLMLIVLVLLPNPTDHT